MRRALLFCVLLISLAASNLVQSPAVAADVTLTLDPPQVKSPTTAVLTGKVTGWPQVTIYKRRGRQWKRITVVKPNAQGVYRATVRAAAAPKHYVATARNRVTPLVTVVGGPAQPSPSSDPIPAPRDACGPQPKKADGSLWTCTFVDEFKGAKLDRSKWMPQTIFKTGSANAWACYIDDPSVIAVRDGALQLTVRKLQAPMTCPGNSNEPTSYAAGMVSTYRLFSQQYGRFEARFKTTATSSPGLHEAFWLWPDDRHSTGAWPAAGEIDIAETYSRYPELSIPFLHYTYYDNWGPVPGLNTAWDCAARRGEFNTYTLEWTPTRLEILINGTTCLVNISGDPAFTKPYIVAFTQALGDVGNEYTGAAPLPATMSIDYLRVWS